MTARGHTRNYTILTDAIYADLVQNQFYELVAH